MADTERFCGKFMTVSGTLCHNVSSLQQRLFSQKETQTGGVENVLSVQKTVCRALARGCGVRSRYHMGAFVKGGEFIYLLNCSDRPAPHNP